MQSHGFITVMQADLSPKVRPDAMITELIEAEAQHSRSFEPDNIVCRY